MKNRSVQLKPQDVVVLLKLVRYGEQRPTYSEMAKELFLSASEVHAGVQRARQARLLHGVGTREVPNKSALEEFLIHGLKYAVPPERSELGPWSADRICRRAA
jgi:hypothetical protein